jgi:hypothetical protein
LHFFQAFGPLTLFRSLLGIATVFALFRWEQGLRWRLTAAIGASLIALSQFSRLKPMASSFSDMTFFWLAGDALRHGQDPYSASPILNTPNSLPLFELFSMAPLHITANLWKAFNLLGCLSLFPLSFRYVVRSSSYTGERLPFGQLIAVSTLVAFSYSSIENINGGQLHVFVALMLILGLSLRGSGHPVAAGLCASLAFLKINTALPMMPTLVNKKSDFRLVVWLGLALLTQVAIAAWPNKLQLLIEGDLRNISSLSNPGGGNDYTFMGPACAGIVSVNHTLYRIGLTDRALIGNLQLVMSASLGAWLTWKQWSGKFTPGKSVAVFSLFSVTFLYHRLYDTVLLVLPLAYSLFQYRRAGSAAMRRIYLTIGIAIVGVFYVPEHLLYGLSKQFSTLNWFVRGVVLPMPFWLIALALGLILAADDADDSSRTSIISN